MGKALQTPSPKNGKVRGSSHITSMLNGKLFKIMVRHVGEEIQPIVDGAWRTTESGQGICAFYFLFQTFQALHLNNKTKYFLD